MTSTFYKSALLREFADELESQADLEDKIGHLQAFEDLCGQWGVRNLSELDSLLSQLWFFTCTWAKESGNESVADFVLDVQRKSRVYYESKERKYKQ